jgi:hypothetical protein
VLTRLPAPHRLGPSVDRRIIHTNLGSNEIVALYKAPGVWKMIADFSRRGIAGGLAYDAAIVACAEQAPIRALLTLNCRDFSDIVPPGIGIECRIDE